MDNIIKVNHEHEVLGWQQKFVHDTQHATKIGLISARQTGKTYMCREMVKDFLFFNQNKRNPVGAVVMPVLTQVHEMYLSGLREDLRHIPPSMIEFSGSTNSYFKIILKRPWIGDVAKFIFISQGSQFRGMTFNFAILDEMQFFEDEEFYSAVISPMLDRDPKAKIVITSTITSDTTPFTKLFDYFREKSEDNKRYYALEQDIYEAKTLSPKVIEAKQEEYQALGQYDRFKIEYLNDRTAGMDNIFPFKTGILRAKKEKRVGNFGAQMQASNFANVSLDIGAAGNSPMWVWHKVGGSKIVVEGFDESLDYLMNLPAFLHDKFNKKYNYINVFLPHDVMHPSVELGETRLANLQKVVEREGLQRFIRFHVIPKTKDRDQQFVSAIKMLDKCYFHSASCGSGIDNLLACRWTQDKKTKAVNWGKWVRNGAEHTADSFRYIYESLHLAGAARPAEQAFGHERAIPKSFGKVKYTTAYNPIKDRR